MTNTNMTDTQARIYQYLQNGMAPEKIARKMGSDLRVINANITRMRNKGVTVELVGATPERSQHGSCLPVAPLKPLAPEVVTVPTTSETPQNVMDKAESAGPAHYDIDRMVQMARAQTTGQSTDVHPLVLMGATIQYLKLTGGRIHAHQLIEDVYGALRSFTAENGQSVYDNAVGQKTQTEPYKDSKQFPTNHEELENVIKSLNNLLAQSKR